MEGLLLQLVIMATLICNLLVAFVGSSKTLETGFGPAYCLPAFSPTPKLNEAQPSAQVSPLIS
jgi:hypothetical protein